MKTLVIVAVAVATVAAAETVCSVRRRRAQSARARCVERITELMVTRGELGDDDILQLRSDFSDRVILDAVVFIASRVCGTSLYRLSFVVEVCESDYHFLSTLARVWRRQQSLLPLGVVLLLSLITLLAGVCGSSQVVVAASSLLLSVLFLLYVLRRASLERRLFADLAATLKALPLFLHAHAKRRGREKIFE